MRLLGRHKSRSPVLKNDDLLLHHEKVNLKARSLARWFWRRASYLVRQILFGVTLPLIRRSRSGGTPKVTFTSFESYTSWNLFDLVAVDVGERSSAERGSAMLKTIIGVEFIRIWYDILSACSSLMVLLRNCASSFRWHDRKYLSLYR